MKRKRTPIKSQANERNNLYKKLKNKHKFKQYIDDYNIDTSYDLIEGFPFQNIIKNLSSNNTIKQINSLNLLYGYACSTTLRKGFDRDWQPDINNSFLPELLDLLYLQLQRNNNIIHSIIFPNIHDINMNMNTKDSIHHSNNYNNNNNNNNINNIKNFNYLLPKNIINLLKNPWDINTFIKFNAEEKYYLENIWRQSSMLRILIIIIYRLSFSFENAEYMAYHKGILEHLVSLTFTYDLSFVSIVLETLQNILRHLYRAPLSGTLSLSTIIKKKNTTTTSSSTSSYPFQRSKTSRHHLVFDVPLSHYINENEEDHSIFLQNSLKVDVNAHPKDIMRKRSKFFLAPATSSFSLSSPNLHSSILLIRLIQQLVYLIMYIDDRPIIAYAIITLTRLIANSSAPTCIFYAPQYFWERLYTFSYGRTSGLLGLEDRSKLMKDEFEYNSIYTHINYKMSQINNNNNNTNNNKRNNNNNNNNNNDNNKNKYIDIPSISPYENVASTIIKKKYLPGESLKILIPPPKWKHDVNIKNNIKKLVDKENNIKIKEIEKYKLMIKEENEKIKIDKIKIDNNNNNNSNNNNNNNNGNGNNINNNNDNINDNNDNNNNNNNNNNTNDLINKNRQNIELSENTINNLNKKINDIKKQTTLNDIINKYDLPWQYGEFSIPTDWDPNIFLQPPLPHNADSDIRPLTLGLIADIVESTDDPEFLGLIGNIPLGIERLVALIHLKGQGRPDIGLLAKRILSRLALVPENRMPFLKIHEYLVEMSSYSDYAAEICCIVNSVYFPNL